MKTVNERLLRFMLDGNIPEGLPNVAVFCAGFEAGLAMARHHPEWAQAFLILSVAPSEDEDTRATELRLLDAIPLMVAE